MEKNCFQILKGWPGEIPPKNKMDVDKLKNDHNIWNFLLCSVVFTLGLNFFLKILLKINSLGPIFVI